MKSWPSVHINSMDKTHLTIAPLSLYNTATQSVEKLEWKSLYRMYVCGITPYDATHLGHAATYLTFDLIHRFLEFAGSQVRFVENITDIDDPLFERAKRDGVDWHELAMSQIELFRGDMVDLHVIPPDHYIGVIESMDLIIAAISGLVAQGSTYYVDGDLYFRVGMDPQFRKRSHISDELAYEYFATRGGDPDRIGKENPFDALVWKAQREGEPGWESPFGVGRPGWHIECSAIALHYLRPNVSDAFAIDIQGGGSDLVFPHHDMSAAQGFVGTKQNFAEFYIHAGMIGLNGEKMSKSLGNLVFVSTLINEGADPMAIRLALMGHHYRSDHMWKSDELLRSTQLFDRLRENLSRIEVAPTVPVVQKIINAISQDLDTVAAISALTQWCDDCEEGISGGAPGELSRALDDLLGLAF